MLRNPSLQLNVTKIYEIKVKKCYEIQVCNLTLALALVKCLQSTLAEKFQPFIRSQFLKIQLNVSHSDCRIIFFVATIIKMKCQPLRLIVSLRETSKFLAGLVKKSWVSNKKLSNVELKLNKLDVQAYKSTKAFCFENN